MGMKWMPVLTNVSGDAKFWNMLFSQVEGGNGRDDTKALDLIMFECIPAWSEGHIESCQNWIFSEACQEFGSSLDYNRILRFLLYTSGQFSGNSISFLDQDTESTFIFTKTQENANSVISLVLHCVSTSVPEDDELIEYDNKSKNQLTSSVDARNETPEWL